MTDHFAHCLTYADWVGRALPWQLEPYIPEMSWTLIRQVCDKANELRKAKFEADQAILKAMEVTS